MLKLTNAIFVNDFVAALNKLVDEPLPVAESYKLVKLIRQLEEKNVVFDTARKKLLDKYGKSGDDNKYKINKGSEEEFSEQYNELVAIEEEYDYEKISLPDDVKITTKDLLMLEELIDA